MYTRVAAMKVHVSQSTKEALDETDDEYELELRGQMEVKASFVYL